MGKVDRKYTYSSNFKLVSLKCILRVFLLGKKPVLKCIIGRLVMAQCNKTVSFGELFFYASISGRKWKHTEGVERND